MELWAFLLLGIGLTFIALEVFFPSFGLLGTVAAGCLIAGAVCAWKASSGTFGLYLALTFVLGPAVTIAGLKLWPKTPMGKALTLQGLTFDPKEAAAGGGSDLAILVSEVGTAETPLRPAGKATLRGRRIDVVTRGELIDAGRRVRVLRVEGNRVVVAEEQS